MDKRRIAIIMIGTFLLTVMAVGVHDSIDEAYAAQSGEFTYELINDNTEVEITKYTGSGGIVEIPPTIEDKPVVSIGSYAFRDCTGLTSVMIPNSVTSISYYAFNGCTSLTSLTMPVDIQIKAIMFQGCAGLTSVTLTKGQTGIGVDYSNYDDSSQNYKNTPWYLSRSNTITLTIEDGVTSIGNSAFYYCTGLTSITIPNSVTSIGDYAFWRCISLTSITIPDGVTSIGDHTFRHCSSLADITLGEGTTSIGDHTFGNCNSLTSITIPDGVTSIGDHTFGNCTSLADITLGEGTKSIGDYAFERCTSLTTITLGESTTSIGDYALRDCTSLMYININEGTTSIGNYAFWNCSSLESIIIPDSVTFIGTQAFHSCYGLTAIIFKSDAPTLGYYCFYDCYNLIVYHPPTATGYTGEEWDDISIEPIPNTPVANFTSSTNNGDAPLKVKFNDTSAGLPKSWAWNFGDGVMSEERNPEHVFATSGTYNVTLTVTNITSSHSQTMEINVNYAITFDTDGGNIIGSISQAYGTAITLPDDPTREGYTFVGWSPALPTTMPAENVTIVAQWVMNYTITFDSAGGSDVDSITQGLGLTITPPENPTRMGYTFAGWSPELSGAMPLNGLNVVAQWTPVDYTITFDSDRGSAVAEIIKGYGTAITPPDDPTREGYTFAGWSLELPETMPLDGMTITAIWKINSYTITFEPDGGTVVTAITQDYDTVITAPANPTKTGYTFSNWDQTVPTTMPAEDMTITAFWNIIAYAELPSLEVIGGIIIQSDKPVLQLTMNAADEVLDNSMFEGLGGKSLTVEVVNDKGNVQYSWTFDGDYKPEAGTFKTGISKIEPESDLSDAISSTGMKNPLVLNFKANGKLPKDATLRYHVGDNYADNTKLTLFFYNETTKQLEEKAQDLVVTDGYVTMSLTHCSSYVLAEHDPEFVPESTAESDNTMLYIGIGVAVVAILAIVAVAFLRRP